MSPRHGAGEGGPPVLATVGGRLYPWVKGTEGPAHCLEPRELQLETGCPGVLGPRRRSQPTIWSQQEGVEGGQYPSVFLPPWSPSPSGILLVLPLAKHGCSQRAKLCAHTRVHVRVHMYVCLCVSL